MSVAAAQDNWTDANQRYLAAELARLKRRLRAEDDGDVVTARNQVAHAALPAPAAIETVAELFGLSAFERDLLLLIAGIEMDAELARVCAEAQGHVQPSQATFALALAALDHPHWSAMAPTAPLRRWRLIEVDDRAGVTNGKLRIDERILHYLAGVNYLDPRLQPLLRRPALPGLIASSHASVVEAVARELGEESSYPVLQLVGDDADGQEDVAALVADSLGLQLHILQAEDIPTGRQEQQALATLWEREAVLLPSALLITLSDRAAQVAAVRLAEQVHTVRFVASGEPVSLRGPSRRFVVRKPKVEEQKTLWMQALGAGVARLNGALDGLSTHFSLSARAIHETGAEVKHEVASSQTPGAVLWNACRAVGRVNLEDLAQRIEPMATWDDLVLPDAQMTILRQIVAHVRHRLTVYHAWGFAEKGARGLGISGLFAGESGTGKTMAAEVLANELHLDLYRIDLSSVVSKYIGETEKNLKRVFAAAEHTGAILLFDEADALFGKRSEVKDSHDRYANIEVSYLLQRMEAYRGLAILTTNLKATLDTAFQRRLRFVVQFPFPDQAQREAIWRGSFPPNVPVQRIDYAKLARLHVAGGHIRNIALNAAFLAADAGVPLTMHHLFTAARTDATKRDRPLSDAETRGWV